MNEYTDRPLANVIAKAEKKISLISLAFHQHHLCGSVAVRREGVRVVKLFQLYK